MKSNALLFLFAAVPTAVLLFAYVAVASSQDSAAIARCASNVEQLAQALKSFAADNGKYPTSLQQLQGAYVKDPALFACPHKAGHDRQSVRLLRAGIMSFSAGILALVLRSVFQRRALTAAIAAVLAVLLFIPGEIRREAAVADDYTYAPPPTLGMLPRLQDNPGNHGTQAINALGPGGTVVPVGSNIPKSPN